MVYKFGQHIQLKLWLKSAAKWNASFDVRCTQKLFFKAQIIFNKNLELSSKTYEVFRDPN